MVGLGLGVWQFPGFDGQTTHWFSAFEESLDNLVKNRNVNDIEDINFSWVDPLLSHVSKMERFSKNHPSKYMSLVETHFRNLSLR